jgi:HEPN domain-containing protein
MSDVVNWWIETSKRDEAMARILMEKNYLDGSAFHMQQAAVKLLKALQLKLNIKDNNLMCVKILETIEESKKVHVDEITSFARKLDLYYNDSRYPINDLPSKYFDESMIVELFVCLERIQTFCKNYLDE